MTNPNVYPQRADHFSPNVILKGWIHWLMGGLVAPSLPCHGVGIQGNIRYLFQLLNLYVIKLESNTHIHHLWCNQHDHTTLGYFDDITKQFTEPSACLKTCWYKHLVSHIVLDDTTVRHFIFDWYLFDFLRTSLKSFNHFIHLQLWPIKQLPHND